MNIRPDLLLTDWMILCLFISLIIFVCIIKKHPHLSAPWKKVFKKKIGMIAFIVLLTYVLIGILDSLHIKIITTNNTQAQQVSVLDLLLRPLTQKEEKTYSKPFAIYSHQRNWVILPNGKEAHAYPRLKYAGKHLTTDKNHGLDITYKIFKGLFFGFLSFTFFAMLWILALFYSSQHSSLKAYLLMLICGKTEIAWREAILTSGFLWVLIYTLGCLASGYHIFGTNKIGEDVLYEAIKSIRTGLLIGTLTTLFMLPFALFFGMLAGYFSGIIDDIIQYLYTTLSSIPGVLLISAMVLVMQVYISNHPLLFPTLGDRADARLLTLCFILGITSWAGLCRLLRAETLKIREQDYVTAAISMGSGSFRILYKHILPNVMHIVLITVVLDFSGLILAESILSYVGVGVDPTTASWGNMINVSRLELARDPMVWWPLLAALTLMFFFVLSANVFADAVRDAFDPRLHNTK